MLLQSTLDLDLTAAELAVVTEHASFALFSVDLGGIVLSWHAGSQRLLGYSPAEIVGGDIRLLVPKDRQEKDRADRYRTIDSGMRTPQTRGAFISKAGVVVPVVLVMAPLFIGHSVQGVSYLSTPW